MNRDPWERHAKSKDDAGWDSQPSRSQVRAAAVADQDYLPCDLPRFCKVHVCGRGFCFTCSKISPFQNPHPYAVTSWEQDHG